MVRLAAPSGDAQQQQQQEQEFASSTGRASSSSTLRNTIEIQASLDQAFQLSALVTANAEEVALAAKGQDFESAEQKILELQQASAAALEAIARAAHQYEKIADPLGHSSEERTTTTTDPNTPKLNSRRNVPGIFSGSQEEQEEGEGGGPDENNAKAAKSKEENELEAAAEAEKNRREEEAIKMAEKELKGLAVDPSPSPRANARNEKRNMVSKGSSGSDACDTTWSDRAAKVEYIEQWLSSSRDHSASGESEHPFASGIEGGDAPAVEGDAPKTKKGKRRKSLKK